MSERFRMVKKTKAITGDVYYTCERWNTNRWEFVDGTLSMDEHKVAETYRKLSSGLVPFEDTIEILQVMPVALPS